MIREYYRPTTIAEAVALKRQYGDQILYYGGGTCINYAPAGCRAERAIGLEGLHLTNIGKEKGAVVIGSGATLQQIVDAAETPAPLKKACGMIITRNVRNMATIGGNIAANRADSPIIPLLLAYGAQVELDDRKGIPIEEYIEGKTGGLILKVLLPKTSSSFAVKRVTRSANGLPVLTAAVKIEKKGERICDAIVVVGGLEDRIRRLGEVERQLIESQCKEPEETERLAATLIQPADDFIGSGEYKRYICGVTVVDCIWECLEQGGEL